MTQTTIGELIADWFYGAEGDDFAGMTVETYQQYAAIAEDVLVEKGNEAYDAAHASDHHFYLEDYMSQFSI